MGKRHAFSPTPAIKTWLKSIAANGLQGVKVAAFDTRIALEDVDSAILNFLVKIFGYAAKPIGDRLTKKGGELMMSPEMPCPMRLPDRPFIAR